MLIIVLLAEHKKRSADYTEHGRKMLLEIKTSGKSRQNKNRPKKMIGVRFSCF